MDAIILHGVKTNNLKNFDLHLEHRKLYVITGVSGSGKSSLAFDTLYAEGQRRYVESLSAYARQFLERMEKPDVESVSGIAPAIAIEAKNVITNARSTVGTQTEINDYLRLLYARIGKTICPECDLEVGESRPGDVADFVLKDYADKKIQILFQVELGKRGKKYLKEFLPELERQGFDRFLVADKTFSSEQLLKSKKVFTSLHVLVDECVAKPKERQRMVESLELAKRCGHQSFQVRIAKKELKFSEEFSCFGCGKHFRKPSSNLFSFNSPLGACTTCQGFGRVIETDWDLVFPDTNRSLFDGAIEPWTKPGATWEFQQLLKFCRKMKIPTDVPWKKLSAKHKKWVLDGVEGKDYYGVKEYFKYLETKKYKMHVRILLSKYRNFVPCPDCNETRLKKEALCVKLDGLNIHEVQLKNIESLNQFIENLPMTESQKQRVEPVYLELTKRVRFLNDVGLGYLSLSRLSRTLSGGEVQRIHLATSLGSALVDTLYVLDEPSVGLHERDNELLIRLLRELRDLGNTVFVVEHDRMMIEAADEVIDLGPTGGEGGGNILFHGSIDDISKSKLSLTGQYLSGEKSVKRRQTLQSEPSKWIEIEGASSNNLKDIQVKFPLQQFVVMTGVSGSGKSTLLYEIMYRHYQRFRGRPVQDIGEVKRIKGFKHVDELILVDQSPIGRSSRSNPVTYIKAFDEIRKLYASLPEAKRQGLTPGSFSFNTDGGRCEVCKGEGQLRVEMHFLADVFVACEACNGKRFKEKVLNVRYRGKNVDDVLGMTIEDAIQFFKEQRVLVDKLSLLTRVGLGYLRLGQSATTLSGGEAQRLKLASEMFAKKQGKILYLFDEPTTGLHYHDIHYLLEAFDELLGRGHSIFVIEHNMEVIRSADYIIDLGPDGGDQGGNLVYQGPLQGLLKEPQSYTGKFLQKHLENAVLPS